MSKCTPKTPQKWGFYTIDKIYKVCYNTISTSKTEPLKPRLSTVSSEIDSINCSVSDPYGSSSNPGKSPTKGASHEDQSDSYRHPLRCHLHHHLRLRRQHRGHLDRRDAGAARRADPGEEFRRSRHAADAVRSAVAQRSAKQQAYRGSSSPHRKALARRSVPRLDDL